MADYTTILQQICEDYLESTCLYEFLGKANERISVRMGIMNTDFADPSLTEPLETHRECIEMKPAYPIVVAGVKVGYLSVSKEIEITDSLRKVLKLIASFVSKMPEISEKIEYGSDAYKMGIQELLFSKDLDRMASLRAQIGLSRFNDKGRCYNSFIISISPFEGTNISSGFELQVKEELLGKDDLWLEHGGKIVLFRVQEGKVIDAEFANKLEKFLKKYKAIGCVSDAIQDPTHDYRLRQHYHQNEHVLLYLKNSGYTDVRLVKYDDYRLVSMVYFALMESNKYIFGPYRYVSRTVMEICKYDEEKGTDYFVTLFTYLNSRFSLNETAQLLNVHRNTVVYRIHQLSEKFGIDFESPEQCFQLNLSCRIFLISKYLDEGTTT